MMSSFSPGKKRDCKPCPDCEICLALEKAFCLIVLSQNFFEGLPIMAFPAFGEVLALAIRKTGVVKDEFAVGALLGQLEPGNRVMTGIPIDYAPSLDNALVGHKLNLPPDDMAGKNCKRASGIATDVASRARLSIAPAL
jgi:hypothetical protein